MSKPALTEPAESAARWLPTGGHAARIALGYWVAASLWFFGSGWLLHHYVRNEVVATRLEDLKGWFFASVTALGLGLVLQQYFRGIRRAARRLQDNETRLRLIFFENSPVAVGISRLRDGTFLDINAAFIRLYGYAREEVIGHTSDELQLWPARNRESMLAELRKKTHVVADLQGRGKSGRIFDLLASVQLVEWQGETCILGTLLEVTERRRAETALIPFESPVATPALLGVAVDITQRQAQAVEIERLNRLYATLSQVNQTIVRCQSHQELFDDICRIMTEFGKFHGARIDEQNGSAGAGSTMVAHQFLTPASLPNAMCGVAAMRTGRPELYNYSMTGQGSDGGGEAPLLWAIQSCAAFPLRRQGNLWGTFSVSSAEMDFFKLEEMRLLQEVAANISYALDRLAGEAQRKRVEEALRLSEMKFSQAFANNPAAIILSRLEDGVVLDVNDSWVAMSGYSREEVMGRSVRHMWPTTESAAHFVSELREKGVIRGLEQELRNKSGGFFAVQFASQCLTFAGEKVILSTFVDVTARKKAEAELRELNRTLDQRVQERTDELRASNEELDAFAYAVSHDLRAPLRTMSGFSQALLEDFGAQLPPAAREYLEHIQSAGRQMGELINGLLHLSRRMRGTLRRDTVDLSGVATRILEELHATEPRRAVTWTVEPGLTVNGDARLFEVVMLNLLGNAWKYTTGTPQAVIQVYRQAPAICVSDNGAGFNMKHAAKLFQPFQRLHREDEFPGLGIGLATVQRIIRRHGGEIRASAAPGGGATFSFNVPQFEGHHPSHQDAAEVDVAGGGPTAG